MPKFRVLTIQEIQELTARRGGSAAIDLSEYRGWIESAGRSADGWGQIELDPTDNVRALKRRTTVAGKELGKTIKWNRRSDNERLIFRVFDNGAEPARRKRTRRVMPAR